MTTLEQVQEWVGAVPDPEIPVLTIADLGVLRRVFFDGETVRVQITPTYSGCPAMAEIAADVHTVLVDHGFTDIEVEQVLSPAWTTDWMTDAGKAKLEAYGIAPPGPRTGPVALALSVRCPQCGAPDTEELSRFGSTACQSLWRCQACREPFTHFRAH